MMHCVHKGNGEAVVFIHGMPTNRTLWDGVIGELCGSFQCFAVDLPGLGNSPGIPYSSDYFERVAQQLESLRLKHGVVRWHIVGHDAGAAVAVHYAGAYAQRVARLALLSPAIFPDLKPYHLLNVLRKPLLGEIIAPVVQLAFWHVAMRRALSSDSTRLAWASFHDRFSGRRGSWDLMRLVRWGSPQSMLGPIADSLPALTMPTLIFQGTHDVLPASFPERAAAIIPHARLVKMDGGHFLPIERPAEIVAALREFLQPVEVGHGKMRHSHVGPWPPHCGTLPAAIS
jgi:pimeloyl-ACP methyl ester carboxylesterase